MRRMSKGTMMMRFQGKRAKSQSWNRASTQVNLDELPPVHGVVAGPPCQPFGKTGAQHGWEDERSQAFVATLQCIVQQVTRSDSQLLFALIENVMGFAQKPSADAQSPLDDVMQFLQEKIGDLFAIWHWVIETSQFGIPQQRKRIYIGMRRISVFTGPPLFNPEHLAFREISLRTLLDPDMMNETPPNANQENNLAAYIDMAKAKHENLPRGAILVCDLSRAPGKVRDTIYRVDGLVPTITCRNRYIYIHSLDDVTPKFHRFLSIAERFMCQGFSPASSHFFGSPNDAYDAVGNAMSMPAVGVAIACALSGIKERMRIAA